MFSAEQLLKPINATSPCGTDLSFSNDFDDIRKARISDDPSLPQGDWVIESKEADWRFVGQKCAALLQDHSKDLCLAIWLTEAAAKTDHLRGLGEGFKLLTGLLEQFWDSGLYPLAEDGNNEQRIGNLSWILEHTPRLVREMALTEGSDTAYSTLDFEKARKQDVDLKCNSNDSTRVVGGVMLADMETARKKNSTLFCTAFTTDAKTCIDALLQLEKAADARLGKDRPSFAKAKDALDTMLHLMPTETVIPASTTIPNATSPSPHSQIPAQEAVPQVHTVGPSGIHTRAQALEQLRLVAQFFRRTEPHSPVSYFADKAANAGEQNLHIWLRSVVKHEETMAHIEELLGIVPNKD